MLRYKVERHYVKHRGLIYRQGDLLPENFTERDKESVIFTRRISQVEIPEKPIAEPSVMKPVIVARPVIKAEPKGFTSTTTGTPSPTK